RNPLSAPRRAPCRPSKPAAVVVTVKDKSLRDRACGPALTVTPRGSQREVGRDEEMVANRPNQEMVEMK
ncbi:hypothetical protein NKI04_34815, partial [Mesorhizobium sp. M0814]|uniref:hypothetical protein n=1 Tax=Mesorhizobium sp. M0814 TaxID=2957004 RepID=UPI00333A381D